MKDFDRLQRTPYIDRGEDSLGEVDRVDEGTRYTSAANGSVLLMAARLARKPRALSNGDLETHCFHLIISCTAG